MLAPQPIRPRPKPALHPLDTTASPNPSAATAAAGPRSGPLSTTAAVSPLPSSSSKTPLEATSPHLAHLRFFPLPAPSPSPSPSTGKRKLFRLKRPSSSSAALQPTYKTDLARLPEHTEGEAEHVFAREEVVPPRPARSPRRSFAPRRPSTASGVDETVRSFFVERGTAHNQHSHNHSHSPLRGFGPVLSASSDFVLSRKKSRSSKPSSAPASRVVSASLPLSPPHPRPAPAQASLQQFSTTDRKILEELRAKMAARAAQFRVVNGKKHHPFRARDVPYPCCYDRRAMDNDVWESKWAQETCGSLTWNVFDEPPLKVLDIGCGTGSWILDAAMQWKNTHFVGLDIVPLHADLHEVGSSHLASRITWVQANFLEGLPFPNEEFDFIHVKRIGRAVPEDKWDALLEELVRVMKPGAAFQLIEEELTFPGKPVYSDPPEPAELPTSSSSPWSSQSVFELGMTPSPSVSSSNTSLDSSSPRVKLDHALSGHHNTHQHQHQQHHTADQQAYAPVFTSPMLALPMGVGLSVATPTVPAAPTPSPTPKSPQHGEPKDAEQEDLSFYGTQDDERPPPHMDPRDHSVLEHIYNEMHSRRFINLEPLALLTNSLSLYFTDVRTHPPVILTFPPLPTKSHARHTSSTASDQPHSHTCDLPFSHSSSHSNSSHTHTLTPLAASNHHGAGPSSSSAPDLSAQPKATDTDADADPGDLADAGSTPPGTVTLAQLTTHAHRYVMLDDARMSAFSPSAKASFPSPMLADASRHSLQHSHQHRRRRSRSFSDFMNNTVPGPPNGHRSSNELFARFAGAAAAGGETQVVQGDGDGDGVPPEKPSRLPNTQVQFDVRSLNMHLALRVQEIVSCAESMWEFVLDRKAELRAREYEQLGHGQIHRDAGRARGDSKSSVKSQLQQFDEEIVAMTRPDFDLLLNNFEMDMQESIFLGDCLQERLGWGRVKVSPNQRRKDFVQACKQWAELHAKQAQGSASVHHPSQRKPDGGPTPNKRTSMSMPTSPAPFADDCPSGTPSRSTPQAASSISPPLPPSERVSRVMRVFVAWKEAGPGARRV